MFKVSKKKQKKKQKQNNVSNIFKVNTKDIRLKSGSSIFNFEHFGYYSTVNIAEFEQINVGRVSEMVASGNKFVSSNYEKCTVQWAGIICRAMCFHYHSPKIRLQKEFSRQLFKKISWTLTNVKFRIGKENLIKNWIPVQNWLHEL